MHSLKARYCPSNRVLVPTTVKNPQSNAICERVHQTLRTMLLVNPPNDIITASDLIDSVLATAMHATRASTNRSLMNNTPGALAFHRDMLLDIPLIADLITIRNSRHAIIDENLRVANMQRLNHDYRVGEQGFCSRSTRPRNSMPDGPVPTISNQSMRSNAHNSPQCSHCRTRQCPLIMSSTTMKKLPQAATLLWWWSFSRYDIQSERSIY
jgi:hypothetical protein